jgi:hypothetical protein
VFNLQLQSVGQDGALVNVNGVYIHVHLLCKCRAYQCLVNVCQRIQEHLRCIVLLINVRGVSKGCVMKAGKSLWGSHGTHELIYIFGAAGGG